MALLSAAVPAEQQSGSVLTFDCVEDPAVQGLPAGIAGGGADPRPAAVGKRVPARKPKRSLTRGLQGTPSSSLQVLMEGSIRYVILR